MYEYFAFSLAKPPKLARMFKKKKKKNLQLLHSWVEEDYYS